jgi:acyl-CoA thioesterase-1
LRAHDRKKASVKMFWKRVINAKVVAVAAVAIISSNSPASAAVRILALGASGTEGYGVGSSENYPAKLQAALRARGIDATVTNAGIFGEVSEQSLARAKSLSRDDVDLVIYQTTFLNDYRAGISLAAFRSNISAIATTIRQRGMKVLITVPKCAGVGALCVPWPDVGLQNRQANGHPTASGYDIAVNRILPAVIKLIGSKR